MNDCERMQLTKGDDRQEGGTHRDIVGFIGSSPEMEIGRWSELEKMVVAEEVAKVEALGSWVEAAICLELLLLLGVADDKPSDSEVVALHEPMLLKHIHHATLKDCGGCGDRCESGGGEAETVGVGEEEAAVRTEEGSRWSGHGSGIHWGQRRSGSGPRLSGGRLSLADVICSCGVMC